MTAPQFQMMEQPVTIAKENITLNGFLSVPHLATGIVIFAHGSGSGRFSPRNRFVAHHLQQERIATLVVDLLTTDEAQDRRNVFDIDLLANRVLMASMWLREDARTKVPALGYVGASTVQPPRSKRHRLSFHKLHDPKPPLDCRIPLTA